MLDNIIHMIVDNSVSDNRDLLDLRIDPDKTEKISNIFNEWLAPRIKEMCETRNYLQRHDQMSDYRMFVSHIEGGGYNYQSVVSGAVGHGYLCRSYDYDHMAEKLREIIHEQHRLSTTPKTVDSIQ